MCMFTSQTLHVYLIAFASYGWSYRVCEHRLLKCTQEHATCIRGRAAAHPCMLRPKMYVSVLGSERMGVTCVPKGYVTRPPLGPWKSARVLVRTHVRYVRSLLYAGVSCPCVFGCSVELPTKRLFCRFRLLVAEVFFPLVFVLGRLRPPTILS